MTTEDANSENRPIISKVDELFKECQSIHRTSYPDSKLDFDKLNLSKQLRLDQPAVAGIEGDLDVSKGTLNNGTKIVVKALRLFAHGANTEEQYKIIILHFFRKLNSWRDLDHINISPLLGFTLENEVVGVVSHRYTNGNVVNYLERYPRASKPDLILDVAEGIGFLHTRPEPLIHANLKGAAIFVTESGIACISDFGFSNGIDSVDRHNGFTTLSRVADNPRWMAPELWTESVLTPAIDVYSFAGVMIEIYCPTKTPYHYIPDDAQVIVFKREGKFPDRTHYPEFRDQDALWSLISTCFSHKPRERPNITSITEELYKEFHLTPRATLSTSPRPRLGPFPAKPNVTGGSTLVKNDGDKPVDNKPVWQPKIKVAASMPTSRTANKEPVHKRAEILGGGPPPIPSSRPSLAPTTSSTRPSYASMASRPKVSYAALTSAPAQRPPLLSAQALPPSSSNPVVSKSSEPSYSEIPRGLHATSPTQAITPTILADHDFPDNVLPDPPLAREESQGSNLLNFELDPRARTPEGPGLPSSHIELDPLPKGHLSMSKPVLSRAALPSSVAITTSAPYPLDPALEPTLSIATKPSSNGSISTVAPAPRLVAGAIIAMPGISPPPVVVGDPTAQASSSSSNILADNCISLQPPRKLPPVIPPPTLQRNSHRNLDPVNDGQHNRGEPSAPPTPSTQHDERLHKQPQPSSILQVPPYPPPSRPLDRLSRQAARTDRYSELELNQTIWRSPKATWYGEHTILAEGLVLHEWDGMIPGRKTSSIRLGEGEAIKICKLINGFWYQVHHQGKCEFVPSVCIRVNKIRDESARQFFAQHPNVDFIEEHEPNLCCQTLDCCGECCVRCCLVSFVGCCCCMIKVGIDPTCLIPRAYRDAMNLNSLCKTIQRVCCTGGTREEPSIPVPPAPFDGELDRFEHKNHQVFSWAKWEDGLAIFITLTPAPQWRFTGLKFVAELAAGHEIKGLLPKKVAGDPALINRGSAYGQKTEFVIKTAMEGSRNATWEAKENTATASGLPDRLQLTILLSKLPPGMTCSYEAQLQHKTRARGEDSLKRTWNLNFSLNLQSRRYI